MRITIQEDSSSPTCQSSPQPFSSFVESSGIVFLSRGLLLYFLYQLWILMYQVLGHTPDRGWLGRWNLGHLNSTWPWPQRGVAPGGRGDGAPGDSGPRWRSQRTISVEGQITFAVRMIVIFRWKKDKNMSFNKTWSLFWMILWGCIRRMRSTR